MYFQKIMELLIYILGMDIKFQKTFQIVDI